MEEGYTPRLLEAQIKSVIEQNQATHEGRFDCPFFLGDLDKIKRQYKKWKCLLPRVELFYAVKCCNEPPVLKLLAAMNVSFDCASKGEIDTILNLGVDPSQIIYANTVKSISSLHFASDKDVTLMTFDNEEELDKIKRCSPHARLILRIRCKNSSHVILNFGMKFGCPLDKVKSLLQKAKNKQLKVVGVSFHVGSGVREPSLYEEAIRDAHTVFETGRRTGFNLTILDIGGGFPGHDDTTLSFETVAEEVNSALDHYFPPESGIRILAEPGRFLVTSAYTWVLPVIGKSSNESMEEGIVFEDRLERKVAPRFLYYVNDGVYGSMTDSIRVLPGCKVLPRKGIDPTVTYPSVVFGPTCDSVDVVYGDISLPELYIGDWIYLENAGAYGLAWASNFNMMPRADVHYITVKTNNCETNGHVDWKLFKSQIE